MAQVKPHKYRAKRTEVDGIVFHSQAEARRYGELKMLDSAGYIGQLVIQPRYKLLATGGEKVGEYRGDFAYWTNRGEFVVEDVKGFDTPLSKWKRKHVKAQYGIDVQIVK